MLMFINLIPSDGDVELSTIFGDCFRKVLNVMPTLRKK